MLAGVVANLIGPFAAGQCAGRWRGEPDRAICRSVCWQGVWPTWLDHQQQVSVLAGGVAMVKWVNWVASLDIFYMHILVLVYLPVSIVMLNTFG